MRAQSQTIHSQKAAGSSAFFLGCLAVLSVGSITWGSKTNAAPATSTTAVMARGFTATGEAVRPRLKCLAASDPLGAAIAAREAAGHRARYLDLRRSLAPRGAALSVAERSPFAAPRMQRDLVATLPVHPLDPKATTAERPRDWDIYAAHTLARTGGVAGPERSSALPADADQLLPTLNGRETSEVGQSPSRPYLVYRSFPLESQ